MEVALKRALSSTMASSVAPDGSPPTHLESRCLVLLDLSALTLRDCTNKQSLSIIKTQSQIDSLAYPETMYVASEAWRGAKRRAVRTKTSNTP